MTSKQLNTFLCKIAVRHSLKISSLPFEPVPNNQYNAQRSAFNIKPKRTQGLVYNPPAAVLTPQSKTPHAFLPRNDPRLMIPPSRVYTATELENYPIINRYDAPAQRSYEVTPEIVSELNSLRQQDPEKWSIRALSKKFNLAPNKVNTFTESLPKTKSNITKSNSDRVRRSKLWLRGEF